MKPKRRLIVNPPRYGVRVHTPAGGEILSVDEDLREQIQYAHILHRVRGAIVTVENTATGEVLHVAGLPGRVAGAGGEA